MPYTDYNQVLQDIADNIREVYGTDDPIRFVDMPDLISGFLGPSISLYGETIHGINPYSLTYNSPSSWKRKLIPYIGSTSGMTNMRYMLMYINQPNDPLDLSLFDTSAVTDMSYMLAGTRASSVDLSSFDTSNVTDISWMFAKMKLTSTNATLDLSHFDTSKVTKMTDTFYDFGCPGTASVTLDVTGWDVSKVTDFSSCFCLDPYSAYIGNSITELDLSGWDTSSASDMISMFAGVFLRKIWLPSTFVATRCPDSRKPFRTAPRNTCHIYTDASSASAQGWGTIDSAFVVHYNSTHADYENA